MRSVREESDDIVVKLGPGDSFGEVFLFDCPRLFTVTAMTNGALWSISRDSYRERLMIFEKKKFKERLDFLRRVNLLSTLTTTELTALADTVVMETFKEGEFVY